MGKTRGEDQKMYGACAPNNITIKQDTYQDSNETIKRTENHGD